MADQHYVTVIENTVTKHGQQQEFGEDRWGSQGNLD